MKFRTFAAGSALVCFTLLCAETTTPISSIPDVPYPEGFRRWMHVTSVITPARKDETGAHEDQAKNPAPHGLVHHLYANALAVEGYRTGHFPEGAVLIADWFFLEEAKSGLVQGARQSTDVMIRDARHAATGGWGFEKFGGDSRTERKAGANAVQSCFRCHERAGMEREFVFSTMKD